MVINVIIGKNLPSYADKREHEMACTMRELSQQV